MVGWFSLMHLESDFFLRKPFRTSLFLVKSPRTFCGVSLFGLSSTCWSTPSHTACDSDRTSVPEAAMDGFYVTVTVMALTAMAVMGAFEETDWGFQSYLDEPYSLKCNHSTLVVSSFNYVEWELPDGRMVESGTEHYELSNGNLVSNLYLTITKVKDSDAGVYVCHVYNSDDENKVKRGQLLRGLNLGGPKYREPFDEYRENLMVGGIAALVLFVPLVSACLIYKFRYQTKEQREAKHAARKEATRHQRHLENNGKGASAAELSEVNGGRGETNPVYDNNEEIGTRL